MAPVTGRPGLPDPAHQHSCSFAWWSVARFTLCTLLLSVLLSLLVLPWLDLSWWKVIRRCVSIAAALSLWLCVTRLERQPLRSLGLDNWRAGPVHGAGKRQLAVGLLLGLGTLALMLAVGLLGGLCTIDLHPDRAKLWRTVLGFIPAALLVGVLEELIFRGFLLQRLLACSTWLAVIVSSACYALVHLRESVWTAATARELWGLFLLGGVLALSVLRTRHLYLAIGLHAALAYGARVNKLVIAIPDSSLSWLTGTSRLINGAASWMVLVGLAGLIVWWTRTTQQRRAGTP